MNQSEKTRSKYMPLAPSAGKRGVTSGFGFTSDWLRESGASFWNQSESAVQQNPGRVLLRLFDGIRVLLGATSVFGMNGISFLRSAIGRMNRINGIRFTRNT